MFGRKKLLARLEAAITSFEALGDEDEVVREVMLGELRDAWLDAPKGELWARALELLAAERERAEEAAKRNAEEERRAFTTALRPCPHCDSRRFLRSRPARLEDAVRVASTTLDIRMRVVICAGCGDMRLVCENTADLAKLEVGGYLGVEGPAFETFTLPDGGGPFR